MFFELAGAMLKNIFQDLVEPDRQDEPIDFGIDIFEARPPECIGQFLHPVEIRDPCHLD